MFSLPYAQFELISRKMQQIASLGTAKNTKKPIYWRITDNNGIKRITAYQLGGANISLTLVPSINGLYELADMSHEGKAQASFDLLATILAHNGTYNQLTENNAI